MLRASGQTGFHLSPEGQEGAPWKTAGNKVPQERVVGSPNGPRQSHRLDQRADHKVMQS